MSNYGKPQYWQNRYSKYLTKQNRNIDPFDWYQRFYTFKQPIRTLIPVNPQTKILVPGCGTSRLPEQLIQQGYQKITCIDNSSTCIKKMTEKYKENNEKITFEQMDAKLLSFHSEFFDTIIDKALYDCIMCAQNASQNGYKLLSEFNRVLKKDGIYFMLSHQPPSRRLPMLQKLIYNWKVSVQKIQKPSLSSNLNSIFDEGEQQNFHYLYICAKQK